MSQIAFAESSPMSHMPKPPSSPTLMPFTPAWVDEEAEPLVPGNDQGSPDKFVADTPGPSALHAQASSFADAMAKPPPPPRDVTAPLPPTLSPVPKPDDAPPTPKTPGGNDTQYGSDDDELKALVENGTAPVADVESSDDERAKSPVEEEVVVARKRKASPPTAVTRASIERAITESDAEWCEANAVTAKKTFFHLYNTCLLEFTVPNLAYRKQYPSGKVRKQTPIVYAIYKVFLDDAKGEPTDAALETLRTLVDKCGVDPHHDKAPSREELLEIISRRADELSQDHYTALVWRRNTTHAAVLKILIDGPAGWLKSHQGVLSAAKRFVADGRDECLRVLFASHRRVRKLEPEEVFDLIADSIRANVWRVTDVLLEALRPSATLVHPKTQSTLLHIAAKNHSGEDIERVLPFSNPHAEDRRGRKALWFIEQSERLSPAAAARTAALRVAMQDAA